MNINVVKIAALQFANRNDDVIIEQLGEGLINQTFKITPTHTGNPFVLQAINGKVFLKPEDILFNYKLVYDCLVRSQDGVFIPEPIASRNGALVWQDDQNNYWRATDFIPNSYAPSIATDEKNAFAVANCFARFTNALSILDIHQLREIIPGFHNLAFRYDKFEWAIKNALPTSLLKSTHVIAELRQRKKLVDFFLSTQDSTQFPSRVMHHDCKINNILFDKMTLEMICPVDMDTVMPGKFFSDLGDMIRTMTCTVDENNTDWAAIAVRPDFYKAILAGYLSAVGAIFRPEEMKNIHYSGLLLIYMQAIRFLSDYLQGDIYYKIYYDEQNLNRALNQLILLEKLEEFLKNEYSFPPY